MLSRSQYMRTKVSGLLDSLQGQQSSLKRQNSDWGKDTNTRLTPIPGAIW